MPTKLTVFNAALMTHLNREPLQGVDAEKKDARILRANWEPAVLWCLEEAGWPVGKVRKQLQRLSETPAFGYDYYYERPSDWLKTLHMSSDGTVGGAWPYFEDEGNKFATDEEALYLLYISKTEALSKIGHWPQRFADYVSAYLALISCKPITGSDSKTETIMKAMKELEMEASNHAAKSQPKRPLRSGSWLRAARGNWSSATRENG